MRIFRKQKQETQIFPLDEYEPVIRCSICTGEQVACMRNRTTGQLREVMLIRSSTDLKDFCRTYQVPAETIKKIY